MSVITTFGLKVFISVIDESAYVLQRLKFKRALEALAVNPAFRTLIVADFSHLYRLLPSEEQIDLEMTINPSHINVMLQCETNSEICQRIEQECLQYEYHRYISTDRTKWRIVLNSRGRILGIPNLLEAEMALSEITAHELRIKADRSEKALAVEREFLSLMSHELRTPINAIIGMTYLTLRSDLTYRQRDYLNKIDTACKNLISIINDVLDFSKIDAGKITLEQENFSLNKVLQDVATLMAERFFNKGIKFQIRVSANVPKNLTGDAFRLTQVLLNLLSNSLKYTEGGHVILSVSVEKLEQTQVHLLFIVQDTGIGISKENLARLFHPFSQGDASISRRYGGTGLGLIICQKLLELMGGSIKVTSKLGKGSCFQAYACFGTRQQVQLDFDSTAIKKLKCLISDDNPMALMMLKELFLSLSLKSDFCDNGKKALKMVTKANAHKKPYDILFLAHCDGFDGLSVAKNIRNRSTICQPRIVLMVNPHYIISLHKVEASWVDCYICKPVQPIELMNTLISLSVKPKNRHYGLENIAGDRDLEVGQENWNLQGLHVLMAEDNLINQEIVRDLLEIEGVRVSIVCNGVDALAWLEKHWAQLDSSSANFLPCDVMLLDLTMAEMDGWECIKRIRTHRHWDELPVVAITARAIQEELDRCLSLGMQDYITKPIDPQRLYKCIQTWGGRNAAEANGGNYGLVFQAMDASQVSVVEQDWPPVWLEHLEGFDIAGALNRMSNNSELYKRLLRSMLLTQSDASERLDQALKHNDLVEAGYIAHTVRGVAANLGATALSEVASCLDDELKQGYCSSAHQHQFQEQLTMTLDRLRQVLDITPPPAGGSGPSTSRFGQAPRLVESLSDADRQLLQRLEGYLLCSDGEALTLLDTERMNLCPILGGIGLTLLDNALQNFDFATAVQIVREVQQ
jgi:two-component system, sensor histidine kinase and response regulator